MEKSSALLLSSFLFLASPLLSVSVERELTAAAPARGVLNSNAAVYIVTLNPVDGLDEESLHVETLSSILGSAEAAKTALIYSYKHVVHGFAARLTPEQAAELTKICQHEFRRDPTDKIKNKTRLRRVNRRKTRWSSGGRPNSLLKEEQRATDEGSKGHRRKIKGLTSGKRKFPQEKGQRAHLSQSGLGFGIN